MTGALEGVGQNSQNNQPIDGSGVAGPRLYGTAETLGLLYPEVTSHILDWSEVQDGLIIITGPDLENYVREAGRAYVIEALQNKLASSSVERESFITEDGSKFVVKGFESEEQAKELFEGYDLGLRIPGPLEDGTYNAVLYLDIIADNPYSYAPDLKESVLRGYFSQYPGMQFDGYLERYADEYLLFVEQNPGVVDEETLTDREEIMRGHAAAMYRDIMGGGAGPQAFVLHASEDENPKATHALIALPDPHLSTKEQISTLIGIDEDQLKNIGIDSEEMRRFVLLHEAKHLTDARVYKPPFFANADKVDKSLNFIDIESYADAGALTENFNDQAGSSRSDMHLANTVESLRAVDTLLVHGLIPSYLNPENFNDHATSGGFNVGEDRRVIMSDFNAVSVAAGSVNVNSVAILAVGNVRKEEFFKEEWAEDYVRGKMKTFLEKRGEVVEDPQELSLDSPLAEMVVGEYYLQDNPLLQYAAVRGVLENGYFQKHSAEEAIAREYVEGMEHLVKRKYLKDPEVKALLEDIRELPHGAQAAQAFNGIDPMMILQGDKNLTESVLNETDRVMSPSAEPPSSPMG